MIKFEFPWRGHRGWASGWRGRSCRTPPTSRTRCWLRARLLILPLRTPFYLNIKVLHIPYTNYNYTYIKAFCMNWNGQPRFISTFRTSGPIFIFWLEMFTLTEHILAVCTLNWVWCQETEEAPSQLQREAHCNHPAHRSPLDGNNQDPVSSSTGHLQVRNA